MDTQSTEQLMAEAYRLPDSQPLKLGLLERAAALADAQNDLIAGFEARNELLDAAAMGGHSEKLLVAFAWMLAQYDRHGEEALEASEYDLLWKYKWVIASMQEFPGISAAQIGAALGDFQGRLERGGFSTRTVHYFRWKFAHHQGDWQTAEQERAVWARSKDDEMGDCTACEAHFLTDYLASQGQHEEALEAARPILSGRQRCAEVPHFTYARVLEPMLHLSRFDEAASAHVRGYRLVRDNPDFLSAWGEHLSFLAYSHNTGPALALLERHLGTALESTNQEARFQFFLGTLPLWARLRAAGETVVKLRVRGSFPLASEDGQYALGDLEGWFLAQLHDLAARFDARNGTDYFAARVKTDEGLLASVPVLALSEDGGKDGKRKKRQQA
jgi:hypothetical protein